jgi:hypothetical protein
MIASERSVTLTIQLPGDLARVRLPEAVDRRLQALLDKQDRGELLTADEQAEAEGLVELAELFSLIRLRAESAMAERSDESR